MQASQPRMCETPIRYKNTDKREGKEGDERSISVYPKRKKKMGLFTGACGCTTVDFQW